MERIASSCAVGVCTGYMERVVVGRRSSVVGRELVTPVRFCHPAGSTWVLPSMDAPIALFTVRVLRQEKAEKRDETDVWF